MIYNSEVFDRTFQTLEKLPNVRALYLNSNQLDFEGIPKSIGKLANLEIFSAGFNLLETVPEGITRCGKLKKLLINNNKLITLPAGIHFMPELKELDIRNNPSLVMPPKPEKVEAEGGIFTLYDVIMTHFVIRPFIHDMT